jgi:hypothetical protein
MLIEELNDAEEEKPAKEKDDSNKVKNVSETLLALCRGMKRKTVGFIRRPRSKKTDFVPSKKGPSFKTCLMLPHATENAGNFRPVNPGKLQREGEKNNEKVIDADTVADSMPKNTKDENQTTKNENDEKRIPRKMTLKQNKNDVKNNGNFPNRQGGILSRSPRNLHSEGERVRGKADMEANKDKHGGLDSVSITQDGKSEASMKIPNALHSYYDRSLPGAMDESNPKPAVDCEESSEKQEEFVMLRISTDQKTCWPTYLGTIRTARRGGDERPTTMAVADILREAEEKLKDVAADEDPFWFYSRSTTTIDEDRAPSIFSTALADKEEGEKSLSPKFGEPESPPQRSETSSPTSEPSSTESDDEGETASCATYSPVYSPCPSLSDESAESDNENNLVEQTVYPNDPIVEGADRSWDPTPQWGTEYNWTQEYRDNEKMIADEWAVAAVARARGRRDDAMSGGFSPPRKDAAEKKKFLDGINDPHGELRAWECPAAVEEREEAKKGKLSMNITSPHGYRTRQIQITQKYPKEGAYEEPDPYPSTPTQLNLP